MKEDLIHKKYHRSQCVYGEESTMPCMFCSATCEERMKDFLEKGGTIHEGPGNIMYITWENQEERDD